MHSRIYIESYNCVTSNAKNSSEFWDALLSGKNGITQTDTSRWPKHIQAFWQEQPFVPISCKIPSQKSSYLQHFSDLLAQVGTKSLSTLDGDFGIILSTTKGAIEDFVWDENFLSEEIDPLSLVLEATIEKLPGLNWKLRQVVSNSCASSHASLALAKRWIEAGACEKVLILAGDLIGPFIHTGFQSLKALSPTAGKPFQEERDGLVLGEAVTAILLSSSPSEFELVDVQISNEAHTVTGPSPEGRGLQSCIQKLSTHTITPDLAIAHGTATQLNDQTEDFVLNQAQKLFDKAFAITGTKWSVGHTLGASGSVDVIAALLCLKHQTVFALPGTSEQKGFLAHNYVMGRAQTGAYQTALVTSLGFGGTNGALLVRRLPV